ncbi:hypothetical protein H5410_058362 [Solanum commersonii]|uniref:Uncharacterized protein n=1 Tax=Solanum commersonii TaxID=4109 RepID=A0A9J5WSW8_SOLCO|nr:hypothetical protein H5410_058362 [Solanum commersonii]
MSYEKEKNVRVHSKTSYGACNVMGTDNINYVVLIITLAANGTYSTDGTQRILTRLGAHLGSEKFQRSLCSSQERLTRLEIRHDGSDEEIQHWELPTSIKRLEVSNLKTLSSQVLKSLTSLQYLYIEDSLPQIQSLQEQGRLPSSLSVLYLCHHDELHSLHLCHLTSLIRLHIRNFPNLQSLSESTLPSSLSQLTIENCNNLQSLSESALPSSLSQLTIENCDNIQSLSESALPSSLSELTISNCRNLHSLSELTLPSSLSVLIIMNCPNLQSLPVKGMPSSLSTLYISNCPLLTPLLEFDKGKY